MKANLINSILLTIRKLMQFDSAEIFNFNSPAVITSEIYLQRLINNYFYEKYDFIELLQIFDKQHIQHHYEIRRSVGNNPFMVNKSLPLHVLVIFNIDIII